MQNLEVHLLVGMQACNISNVSFEKTRFYEILHELKKTHDSFKHDNKLNDTVISVILKNSANVVFNNINNNNTSIYCY